ncbi:substrate-binding domain-containing protein [Kitasatospora sp. cg17-2]
MYAAQRHDAILRRLRRRGSVRVVDLAEQLGVSVITVRRDIALLDERGLLVRVHGGAMLRKPAEGAKRGRKAPTVSRLRSIGMLVPSTSYYFHELVLGAQAAADVQRMRLILAISGQAMDGPTADGPAVGDPAVNGPTADDPTAGDPAVDGPAPADTDRDRQEVDRLIGLGVEGLLLTTTAGAPAPTWLNDLTVPFVLVERRQPLELDPVEYVASDHEYGAFLAFRHLAARGHRRIAVFTERTPTSPWIHAGYRTACRMFGLDPGLPQVDGPAGPGTLEAFLEAALAAGATAVLAHPDDKAVLLLQWLGARDLSVPDDVAIVSYDDEIAAFADVPITAVAPPRRAIGHTAAQRLLSLLAADHRPTPGHIHLIPALHVRDSTDRRIDRF